MNHNIIHKKALKQAKALNQNIGDLLKTLVEVDEQRVFVKHGYTHLTPYCIKALKIDESIAQTLVRIVNRSHFVPELAKEVIKGNIQISKAKTIASVITPENKDEWLEHAKKKTKAKLEKAVAEAVSDGKKRLVHNYTYEAYENLKRNQDLLSTKSGVFVTEEVTVAWALKENLKNFDPLVKAECSQGRRGKLSIEKQVTLRDEDRCTYVHENGERCEERKWLHHHHMTPRSEGGPDTLDNFTTLCSGHHRIVHANMH